jgi:hypothetical protein
MGLPNSTLAKDLDGVDQNEKFWGLENFGNTCYINSVLQALFYCKIFRDKLIKYVDDLPCACDDGSILFALVDLFKEVRTGVRGRTRCWLRFSPPRRADAPPAPRMLACTLTQLNCALN